MRDTTIARCGVQLYHADELPDLQADDDGWISVDRDPTEVFSPMAMASFEGKPIVDDHPPDVVTPSNHRQLVIGHVQHVRRSADGHSLIADLIFTDAAAIRQIRSKQKLALSCGYDAQYEQDAPGRARQRRIIGNHVALVAEGRCGVQCMIGDRAPPRPRITADTVKLLRDRQAAQRMALSGINRRHAEFWKPP